MPCRPPAPSACAGAFFRLQGCKRAKKKPPCKRGRRASETLIRQSCKGRQVRVLVHIGADQLLQAFIALGRDSARSFDALADRGIAEAGTQRGLQLGQDVRRQVFGCGKREPAGERIALECRMLAQCGHILEAGQASGGRDAQCLEAAVRQERRGRERRNDGDIDVATAQAGGHGRRAAVGHMGAFQAGALLDQLEPMPGLWASSPWTGRNSAPC